MKQQEFEARLQAACRDACRQDLAALDALTPVDAAPVRPARRRARRPLRVDRKQDALVIGLEEKAAAPETIPERMEFGYLPDGWTVTWDETADTEKTCRATLSDENGPQLWVSQYPLAYEMEAISYKVTDLSPEERQEFLDVIESQGADGLRAFAEEHGLAPGAERMEQNHKTLDSITDLTANMLNDRVATLSWATPDCWYYVTLASTGYETVERDTVLRILQGITP
ncbi:MAG TPA: hypothetical protein H9699_07695 [Candidatus Gemmiger stercoravium]|nr:hypothetical protein [Candidatus Gemmiger stercoravium]